MRHSSLIEYVLIALVIVLAVSAAFTYVWPIADVFAQLGKVIGTALAGTK
jgi:hypothetical protein